MKTWIMVITAAMVGAYANAGVDCAPVAQRMIGQWQCPQFGFIMDDGTRNIVDQHNIEAQTFSNLTDVSVDLTRTSMDGTYKNTISFRDASEVPFVYGVKRVAMCKDNNTLLLGTIMDFGDKTRTDLLTYSLKENGTMEIEMRGQNVFHTVGSVFVCNQR